MLPGEKCPGSTRSPGTSHTLAYSRSDHNTASKTANSLLNANGSGEFSQEPIRQSSIVFYLGLVLACTLFAILAFGPTLEDLDDSSDRKDGKPLWNAARWAFSRDVLKWYFWGWLILATAFCLLGLPRRRDRGWRMLALLLAILHNAALLRMNYRLICGQDLIRELRRGDIYMRQWPALRQLKIIESSPPDFAFFPTRMELLKTEVETFRDLHQLVIREYQRQARRLASEWAFEDEQKRRALFLMNFVAGFWAFGNRLETEKPGGVLCNELNDWQERPLNFRTYLEATVGCCSDQAYLAKCLLDREGIENRLTAISGHIFNEVKLGSRWCVLDATSNLFLEMSWEELYAMVEPGMNAIPVLLFPHPGLTGEFAAQYRPIVGHFRLLTLLRIANRPKHFQQTSHPELPPYFN